MKASARRGPGRRRARRRRDTTARARGLQPAGPPLFFFIFLAVCARSLTRLRENSFLRARPLRNPSPGAHGLAVPGASFVGGRGQHAARLRGLLLTLARSVRRFAPVI